MLVKALQAKEAITFSVAYQGLYFQGLEQPCRIIPGNKKYI